MRRGLRAAAEAAAGEHGLDLHLLGLQSEHSRDRRLFEGLELAAEPRQRLLAVEAQIAVERLHRRMREIGKDVFRLDHASAGLRIAASASPCFPATRPGLRASARYSSTTAGCRAFRGAVVPGDLQQIARLDRGPGAVRINRNAASAHSSHRPRPDLARLASSTFATLRAEPLADARPRTVSRSGLANVDGELRGAVDLGGRIELVHARRRGRSA